MNKLVLKRMQGGGCKLPAAGPRVMRKAKMSVRVRAEAAPPSPPPPPPTPEEKVPPSEEKVPPPEEKVPPTTAEVKEEPPVAEEPEVQEEPEEPKEPPMRALWYPGNEPPVHLDGTMAGDYGFDPLSLGSDPELLKWFQQAELQHARWAMLGAAGILGPELATKFGVQWPGAGVNWVDAALYDYGIPFSGLLFTQLFLMGWVEQRRWQDMNSPGSQNDDPLFPDRGFTLPDSGTPGYPGGFFDPFSWSKKDLDALKTKEIKNGRLAMIAFVGFAIQALVTHQGPVENLTTHFNSPANNTIFQSMGH